MRVLHPVERPADRSPVRWAFDVLVALVAAGAAVPNLLDSNSSPQPVSYVALALLVLPLVVRRIWPVPVFAWLLVASAVVLLLPDNVISGFALNAALYTVASLCSRREIAVCTAALEAVALAVSGSFPAGSYFFDALLLSLSVAASVALGLYVATRRAYLRELHDRAERLERERDQQGALAAAAERARIAREMHDIVAHHLTVMVAMSDGAIAASVRSPERGVEAMRTVSATGRRALADTRRLLGVLRSERDDADGDAASTAADRQPLPDLTQIDDLIERVRAAGLPVTLEIHGAAGDVPRGVQLTVYRLVQEALTNTLKHGGAGACSVVRLRHLPGALHVEIDDDGAGKNALVPVGGGGGLAGMRERVHAFGGDLDTGPRRTGGWRVVARLGLDDAGARADG